MRTKMRSINNELERFKIFARHDRKMAKLLLKKDTYKMMSLISDSFRKDFEKYMKSYVKRLDAPKVTKIKGVKFFHRVRDLESLRDVFHTRDYSLLKEFLPKNGDYIIDAGAGVGEYTIIASVMSGKKGKVLAIEANSHPFRYLKKNAKLNPFKNIFAMRAAVSGKNGKIKLFRPAGTSFIDSIMKNWSGKTESYSIKSVTVDSLVKRFGMKKLNLLKLDIEGAELLALKGSKNTMSKMKPRIIIETHGRDIHKNVIKLLKRSGYKIDIEKIKFEDPFIAMVYSSSKSS